MKHLSLLIILFVAACSPAAEKSSQEDQIKKAESSLVPAVYIEGDSLWTIEARMKHYGVPGVSMAVIVDNQIAWTKTYGIVDKETNLPVTDTTLFQAGSISKPVAAYGALKAVDLGKINPDQNVNDYLVSWKIPDNEFTKEEKVTLKHLLSHTGGLTVHGFLGYSPDLPVPTLLQVLNGEPPANSPAIFVDKLPGESYRYSGGGYTIMQQMLIDLEGKPFQDILKSWVLQPLQMDHSTYSQPLTGHQLAMAATGYLPDHMQTKGKRHTYPEMAAAGLWTTATDLAKFAIDIQNTYAGKSTPVLTQPTVQLMLTPYIEDFNGLGIFIDKKGDEVYFQHGGWDEGFSSQLKAHRDKGVGVVVLTNSNHPAFIDELIRSVALTYNWPGYVPTYRKQEITAADKQVALGKYKYDSDEIIKIYEENGRLYFRYLRWEPMEMFKVSDSSYVRKERTSLIMFKTHTDGKPYLVFSEDEGERKFSHPRMAENEKVPYEYLVEGDWDKALTAYQQMKKAKPDDPAFQEETINRNGYNLLENGDKKMAAQVFKMNIALHPRSANTYDSYADALVALDDRQLAIENYKKALKLDATLTETKEKLEKLKAGN